jgi:hypothetical protein
MSNITQFFPAPSSSSGGKTISGSGKLNREIYLGPASVKWIVPPNITEVEVHCWGGGGNGGTGSGSGLLGGGGGGGGGGYVTHVYPVSAGQVLSITVGGNGGTSSVSCPAQSPTSPISATGGSSGSPGPGGAGGSGGSGTYSIAPGISTSSTFAASGGSGGAGSPNYSYPLPSVGGGGGAAGSWLGTGGNGGAGYAYGATGGGIGGPGITGAGSVFNLGGPGIKTTTVKGYAHTVAISTAFNTAIDYEHYRTVTQSIGFGVTASSTAYWSNSSDKISVGITTVPRPWFYVQDAVGFGSIGGAGWGGYVTQSGDAYRGSDFLGGTASMSVPNVTSDLVALGNPSSVGGGGGGGSQHPSTSYTRGATGGVGCVIIYY